MFTLTIFSTQFIATKNNTKFDMARSGLRWGADRTNTSYRDLLQQNLQMTKPSCLHSIAVLHNQIYGNHLYSHTSDGKPQLAPLYLAFSNSMFPITDAQQQAEHMFDKCQKLKYEDHLSDLPIYHFLNSTCWSSKGKKKRCL